MGRAGMDLITRTRSLLAVGECTTPHGRALVCEQFRILTNQVPILYAVLLLDSISIGFVLPSSVNGWLRFALPGALLAVSVIRMIQWIRMRGVEFAPEQAYRFLTRMRILSAALPAGFLIWTLALIEVVDPTLRAPISLLVFMGCIGSAYCLGIFPPASRLTLLLAGLPLATRLLASGEPLLVCIGINLGLLLVLFIRMINTNFGNFVRLIETQARLAEEGERARAAHAYLTAALDVVPEGLAIFDKDDRLVLWNRQYPALYASNAEAIVQGARFDDILRAGLRHRQYADAVGREEEWLRERMARHALPQSSHEQQLPGDRWSQPDRGTADRGRRQHRHPCRYYRPETQRGFVPAAVRGEPAADVGGGCQHRATVGGQHRDVLPLRLSARRTARDVGTWPQRRQPLSVGAGTDAAGTHHPQDFPRRPHRSRDRIAAAALSRQGRAGVGCVRCHRAQPRRAEGQISGVARSPDRAAQSRRIRRPPCHIDAAFRGCRRHLRRSLHRPGSLQGSQRPVRAFGGRRRAAGGLSKTAACCSRRLRRARGRRRVHCHHRTGAVAGSRRTAGRTNARRLPPADRNRRPRAGHRPQHRRGAL